MADQSPQLEELIKQAPRSVQGLYRARLRGLDKKRKSGEKTQRIESSIRDDLVLAIEAYERRKRNRPTCSYPEDLPVSEHREEIMAAIRDHQVVILCGETGSGKTTQLPKICLDLGRGVEAMIGHTQPRRIAARNVASRVAEELGVGLGTTVGYKMRFGDQTNDDTMIKVMTDGILLAETRSDPELRKYDTIIVDEAHERSLNIDFLMGYLHRLLSKRKDLKVIITSATIDADRFAEYFGTTAGPAPVIEVSGRMYPVEQRYDASRIEEGMPVPEAASYAAAQLMIEGHGDVLVFMPGEREIRQTAHELNKLDYLPQNVEVLPLYARLSPAEQQRVFQTGRGGGSRIVIATNVAETSITVPNIRGVVDPGVARLKRYNPRTKLHGLLVEPVSQASANQRAGRCGRVAPGVCIRLYEQDDFERRDEFTQPELLRSNLASVILQMIDLRLGEPDEFPFIDPPDRRQWRDGYETLHELGAIDEQHRLTEIGKRMARLPVDPRVARMVLAGDEEDCLNDVLVIASVLSTQDPRVRPHEKQQQADEAHEQFAAEGSDFLSYLNIWEWYHEQHKDLTRRKLARACERAYLAVRRIDEWREVYRQLRGMCVEMKLDPKSTKPRDPDAVHRALMTGLLTNIGKKGERHEYQGTRGSAFSIIPGSSVFESRPEWVMAGEIVRTTKVYARTVAKIQPKWVEDAAHHLIKKSHSNPRWNEKNARVMADERVSLYGLDIVPRRSVHFGPIDSAASRELFIHHALVEGEMQTRSIELRQNRQLLARLKNIEDKARRGDLIANHQAIYQFYDRHLPPDIYNGQRFEKWAKQHGDVLRMTENDLVLTTDSGVTGKSHPDSVEVGPRNAGLSYRYLPGEDVDGVSVRVRVEDLPHLTRDVLEWSVPGYLVERMETMIRSLPKQYRRQFDAPALAREILPMLDRSKGSVQSQLAALLSAKAGVTIRPDQFRSDQVPEYLKPRIVVIDERGKEIASGRDLKAIKDTFKEESHKAIDEAAGAYQQDGLRSWDIDDLDEQVEFEDQGRRVLGYPTMAIDGNAVNVRVRASSCVARKETLAAQGMLLAIGTVSELRIRLQQMPGYSPMMVHGAACGFAPEELKSIVLARAGMILGMDGKGVIRTREEFEARLLSGLDTGMTAVQESIINLSKVFGSLVAVRSMLESKHPNAWDGALSDIEQQIHVLTRGQYAIESPTRWLWSYPRFIRAVELRLDRMRKSGGVSRDAAMMKSVLPWSKCIEELRNQGAASDDSVAGAFEDLFWMVQEYRVAVFAQELRTSIPVSEKRLREQLDLIIK
ncbi:MAG: ATP-dependent RNA helicase HrpA [Phycisphaerales bacterium]|nr:ATP-dependent RNA helicase HrpA [Phycisphaerales bacterium]